jgi:hypothetical protein
VAALSGASAVEGCARKRIPPETYASDGEHFKYGSIGSDIENGLPIPVLLVLPRLFPEHLPKSGPRDYRAFGFLQEEGHELPIGFSRRKDVIALTGLNCAVCHVGEVRDTPRGPRELILAMPANTVDLQAFFAFLFRCAEDARFRPDVLLAEIEKDRKLSPIDRLVYKRAISQLRQALFTRRDQLARFLIPPPNHPPFGPGRVDTFNPYKVNQFAYAYAEGIPPEERIGTVDLPSVWNQLPREGMNLHWDGDNDSVEQRNVSAAFGAGATRDSIDLQSIQRVKLWLDRLPAPEYPWKEEIDAQKAKKGEGIYRRLCYDCHDFQGARVGTVVPIDQIGTDRHRLDSYTVKLQQLQLRYDDGYTGWSFSRFRKTNGYANQPLDGIWARAPYLHNGSVPTLWGLLQPAKARPREFYRGHGVYDRKQVGFSADAREVEGRQSFLFDTSAPGNGNQGHAGEAYGTTLSEDEKWALVEYLKTK